MEISLTLSYWGELLDPELITKSLGIQPTDSKKKGDKVIYSRGSERTIKNGYWWWTTENEFIKPFQYNNENGLSNQLDLLVLKFSDTFSKVFELLKIQEGSEYSWLDIHVISDDPEVSVPFFLSNRSMITLCKTGLFIKFTVSP